MKVYKAIARILLVEEWCRQCIQLVHVAMYLMNDQISCTTGYAVTKLCLGHQVSTSKWSLQTCATRRPRNGSRKSRQWHVKSMKRSRKYSNANNAGRPLLIQLLTTTMETLLFCTTSGSCRGSVLILTCLNSVHT